MLSKVPVQVASSEELLPAGVTAVVLHVEVNSQDVSLHHRSAVLSFELPLAKTALVP